MATEKQYQQCRLTRHHRETTAWIEQRGAKLAAVVELLPSREKWRVAEVFERVLPESALKATQLLNRGSLPSIDPIGR